MSLLDALFTTHTTFSHHFDHAAFDVMVEDTDCMLLDIINYIPTKVVPSIIANNAKRNQRISHQNSVLKAFCAAYTSFYGHVVNAAVKNEGKPTCERDDRDMKRIMAFGLCGDAITCVFEEARITAVNMTEDFSFPPTGKIDFVMISEGIMGSANTVAVFKCIDDYLYPHGIASATADEILPTYERMMGHNVIPTTNSAFSVPGSNCQAIVELLALSEVLVRESGKVEKVKAVIILKASMNKFQPFFYFPNKDLLITTKIHLQRENQ